MLSPEEAADVFEEIPESQAAHLLRDRKLRMLQLSFRKWKVMIRRIY